MRKLSWNIKLGLVAVVVAAIVIATVVAWAYMNDMAKTKAKVLRADDLNKNRIAWQEDWRDITVVTTGHTSQTPSGILDSTSADLAYYNDTGDLNMWIYLVQYTSQDIAHQAYSYYTNESIPQNLTEGQKALGIEAMALYEYVDQDNDSSQMITILEGDFVCNINLATTGIQPGDYQIIFAVAELQAAKI